MERHTVSAYGRTTDTGPPFRPLRRHGDDFYGDVSILSVRDVDSSGILTVLPLIKRAEKVYMDTNRLKMKIGVNEFEAEGDPDVVKAQLQAFMELVALAGATKPEPPRVDEPPPPALPFPPLSNHDGQKPDPSAIDSMLGKIMKVEGRVVSLTVRAPTIDDAVLLILYGHKMLRSTEAVGGFEVMQGLTTTGQRVDRVDRVLDKAGREGLVIIIGERRSRRYRIANPGITRARQVAGDLIAMVA